MKLTEEQIRRIARREVGLQTRSGGGGGYAGGADLASALAAVKSWMREQLRWWGQGFDEDFNPITGAMTVGGAITASGAITAGGLMTANGNLKTASYIEIGSIRLVYDQTNNAIKVVKSDGTTAANLYATGGLSAFGAGADGQGGGGVNLDTVWTALRNNTNEQINASHLSDALGSYIKTTTANASYVTALSTNGNYLTWTKNGSTSNITVPYATSAGSTPNLSSTTTKTLTGVSYHAGSDGVQNSSTAREWGIPEEATADYAYKNVQILRLSWTGNGYSTDILTSPNAHGGTGLFYRQLVNGSYATPDGSVHGGWRMILDKCNSSVALDGQKLTVKIGGTSQSLTNTWRGIQNNLTSTSTTDSLSAYQGYLLANGSARDSTKVAKSGDTMTGPLVMARGLYATDSKYGLHMSNSDIIGINGLFTEDVSDAWSEGLNFMRTDTKWDTFRAVNGSFLFETETGATELARLNAEGLYLKKGWLRTYASCGWYSETYGGGIYMKDSTWIRTYGSKSVYCDQAIQGVELWAGAGAGRNSGYQLYVNGTAYVTTGIYSAGYVTALSDERRKDIDSTIRLRAEDIARMRAVRFHWKDGHEKGLQAGSIAQDWQQTLPEAVRQMEDGTLTLDYAVTALTSAISLAQEIVALKKEIEELKKLTNERK